MLTGATRSADDLSETDWRRTAPRSQGENFERNMLLLKELRQKAAHRELTLAQLALAWLLHQPANVVPLFGATGQKWLRRTPWPRRAAHGKI